MNNNFSLADFLAEKILSSHNQFVSVRFVGVAGKGKSWAAISLCLEVAKIIAKKKGGTPADYFEFDDDHMSVMNVETLKQVMHNPKKNSVLFLDDVGTSAGARTFMAEDNIEVGKIFQTFRPQNNLVVMTLQDSCLVDKTFRILCHYEIEMEQNFYDRGLSIAKVQEIKLNHKTGEIHYPYIVDEEGNKIRRVIFERPPKDRTDRYEAVRAEMLAKIQSKDDDECRPIRNDDKITLEMLLEPDILKVYDDMSKIGATLSVNRIAKEVSKINRFKKTCNQQLVRKVLDRLNMPYGKQALK